MEYKKKIDVEYSTQDLRELDELSKHGIRYVFVKTNQYGVRTYKYEKTHKLFETLANYYKEK